MKQETYGKALFVTAFLIESVGFLVAVGDAREDRWRRRQEVEKKLLEDVVELKEKLNDVLRQDEETEAMEAHLKKAFQPEER